MEEMVLTAAPFWIRKEKEVSEFFRELSLKLTNPSCWKMREKEESDLVWLLNVQPKQNL